MEPVSTKKVCIIGGGPRGLVTARHLSESKNLSVTVFEAQEDVGGVWLYKERNELDAKFNEEKKDNNFYDLYGSFQQSIYPNLITNLPYFYMELKDLGMKDINKDTRVFLTVGQYKQYLDAYTEKFNLKKYIQFSTTVSSVRIYKNLDEKEKQKLATDRKFLVKTVPSNGQGTNETYHDFDYIVVANGQYCVPYSPKLQGIEKFKGKTMHCKDYRYPNKELFLGKKVVILGGSYSAFDMLTQLLHEKVNSFAGCEKVILCSRKAARLTKSDDFRPYLESGKLAIHPGTISELKENTACFSDGSEEEVDTIVYATGYKFKFPYFDFEKDKIIDHDENEHRGAFFGPIYRKLVAIREPDVFFVGFLGMTILVHIVPELQAMAVKYIIEGKLKLPSQEEMMKSFNQEVEDHQTHIGDLAHFFKTNLSSSFPTMPESWDRVEWKRLSDWLKPVHPNNNEEKSEKFYDRVNAVLKAIATYYAKANYITFRNQDYLAIYPEDFRNTSEFV